MTRWWSTAGAAVPSPTRTRSTGWTTRGSTSASRGPFTVPRSPQGQPVVIQAGQSGRGKLFAARWGELIFASYKTLAIAKAQYAELKGAVSAAGRDPDSVRIAPPSMPWSARRGRWRRRRKPIWRAWRSRRMRSAYWVSPELRLLEARARRRADRCRHGRHHRAARAARPHHRRLRHEQPDAAPLHREERPRHHLRDAGLLRHRGRCRRRDGGMVPGRGLRRLRRRRDPPPRRLRGLLPLRGAGAAAARRLPPGYAGTTLRENLGLPKSVARGAPTMRL